MRDLSRRLSALETRPGNRAFQRVVILGPDDPSPPDSDDVHIIRIVAAGKADGTAWARSNDRHLLQDAHT
jgi:hypothetical protein